LDLEQDVALGLEHIQHIINNRTSKSSEIHNPSLRNVPVDVSVYPRNNYSLNCFDKCPSLYTHYCLNII